MVSSYDFFKVGAVGANNHNVVPNFPIVIVTFDSFLQYFPSTGFLTLFNIRIGQIVPCFKILKNHNMYQMNYYGLWSFQNSAAKKGFKNGASQQMFVPPYFDRAFDLDSQHTLFIYDYECI